MAIVRWAPYDLASEGFDDLVRRTFGDFGTSLLQRSGNGGQWTPAMDAFLEGEELHVRLELPGIDPDNDVDIEVENGILRVSGERKQETKSANSEGTGWFRREMHHGTFERRIGLPDGVNGEAVRATYDAGILDITIPLPEKPRTKVKVDVGNTKQLKQ